MNVLELKGEAALDALNGLYTLLMGVKMLPQYENEPLEDFVDRVARLEQHEQTKIIRLGLAMVRPDPAAVRAMLSFCTDANNVRYTKENFNNLTMPQMLEMMTAVCVEILSWDIGLLSNAEKKK